MGYMTYRTQECFSIEKPVNSNNYAKDADYNANIIYADLLAIRNSD